MFSVINPFIEEIDIMMNINFLNFLYLKEINLLL